MMRIFIALLGSPLLVAAAPNAGDSSQGSSVCVVRAMQNGVSVADQVNHSNKRLVEPAGTGKFRSSNGANDWVFCCETLPREGK